MGHAPVKHGEGKPLDRNYRPADRQADIDGEQNDTYDLQNTLDAVRHFKVPSQQGSRQGPDAYPQKRRSQNGAHQSDRRDGERERLLGLCRAAPYVHDDANDYEDEKNDKTSFPHYARLLFLFVIL